jgi:hypothetical protein
MAWYLIGPDKTGLNCSSCCAAFRIISDSCAPLPCSTDGQPRSYICPSTAFPTPDHVYSYLGGPADNVTIEVNPVKCGNSTECYSYEGGPLNSGGRIGTGCSQEYVTSLAICGNELFPCEGPPPDCGPCASPVTLAGIIYKSCFKSAGESKCGCYSCSESREQECGCVTTTCLCCGYVDPETCCNTECIFEYECPDGTIVTYNSCTELPSCPCAGSPEPDPPCTECQEVYCAGETLACRNRSCPSVANCTVVPWASPCGAGYSCSCGTCSCTSQSTCCVGASEGWSYSAGESRCIPCYEPIGGTPWVKEDCCDSVWQRKRCDEGKVCCNDGRCYDESTVLCEYPS